jgi:hypothetical protein
MENVDISEWVKSALVIDDKWTEVKGLIQTLNSHGVSTSYYNPNPGQDILLDDFDSFFPKELEDEKKKAVVSNIKDFIRDSLADLSIKKLDQNSLTGYNLIFLDIDFGIEAAAVNVKSQVNFAIQMLADALSEQSTPYGIILWSKESSLPHDGKDGSEEPTFEYIKKMLLCNSDLSRKPKPPAALTCKDIQNYAEKLTEESQEPLETEFFNILKYATYSYFGFSRNQDTDVSSILSRYAFSYMSIQLYDKLHSHFCQKDISGVFDSQLDDIQQKISTQGVDIKELYGKLRTILKRHGLLPGETTRRELEESVKKIAEKYTASKLHSVLAELNFRSLFDLVKPDLKGQPGLIHCDTFKNGAVVYLNITPPCDIAQGRNGVSLYLSGKIKKYKTYTKALESFCRKDGERIYKTPPALKGNKYLVFYFDLKNILQQIDDKEKSVFILKDSIFADLMQKFGHHNSRLGARTFY